MASASFVTLLTIVITTALIRVLGQAAAGKIDDSGVVSLILFTSMNYLGVILVLTTFIAVLMVVSRSFRDREMSVWWASGLSLNAWIHPVLRFSIPMMLIAMSFSVMVSPWAKRQSDDIKQRFEKQSEVTKVSAGQFRETASGSRVFFIEKESADKARVENVFVASRDGERLSIVVSKGGHVETFPNKERFLVLSEGRRFDLTKHTQDFSALAFERYGIRLEPGFYLPPDTTTQTADVSTLFFEGSATSRGELLWRFSLPLSGILLSLLAIPLSFVNPRGGRSLNLVIALLIYLFYSNCLSIAQAWVSQGRAGFWPAFVLPHAVALLMVYVMMYRRNRLAFGARQTIARWFKRERT